MRKQYWVIGGEYRDADFDDMDPATSIVHGPFRDYDKAYAVWRERSVATRSQYHTRYTIVVSAPNPRAQTTTPPSAGRDLRELFL
jgi:hypothetical protein